MESEILRTPWMEEPQLSQEELPPLPTTWTTTTSNNIFNNLDDTDHKNDDVPFFKSFLQVGDWFINSSINHDIGFTSNQNENFQIQPLDPSPSSTTTTPPPHAPPSFTPTPFFNLNSNNNLFTNDLDYGSEPGLLYSNSSVLMGFNTSSNTLELSSKPEFSPTRAVELNGEFTHNTLSVVGELFHGLGASKSLFSNQANVLQQQAIDVPTPAAVPPQPPNCQGSVDKLGALEIRAATRLVAMERKRKISEVVDAEAGLNDDCDDDDNIVEINKSEETGNNFEANNINDDNNGVIVDGGIQKGKKKAVPAKNLMAERRRRKKLNDRLYMLRSVVPKISKMDRASILGDAIEYMKDLVQKVNDLHNELGSIPLGSSLRPSSSFHPVTPSQPTLPSRVKDELCLSSLATLKSHSPKVEVRLREGRAINIRMFCAGKPGLFLSTMRALDSLGLNVQQAVISCFNGFVLDVFRAEQCREGLDLLPEQIKAVLLQAVGFHGMM